jgi:hypothetical protein
MGLLRAEQHAGIGNPSTYVKPTEDVRNVATAVIPKTHARLRTYRKPFIVDAPATMLKCNAEFSRNARILYQAMRSMADGKSGHLKIRGRWLRACEFDRAAEMCRCVRLRAMRELVTFGLVSVERVRVERFINGRRRVVLGPCRYTVHREPTVLQQSISSTVEEIDSQVLSNPPMGAGGSGFPAFEVSMGGAHKSSSAPRQRTSDDDEARSPQSTLKGNGNPNPSVEEQSHVEKIIGRAAPILEKCGEDPIFVAEALAFIDQRSHDAGTVPGSERYYIVAYETLLESRDDLAQVTDTMIWKKYLREKYMPETIVPNERDVEKIEIVHHVVEEAACVGRPATAVLADRRFHESDS